MKNRVKKIIFTVLCAAFLGLCIFCGVRAYIDRGDVSVSAPSDKPKDEPEMRTDLIYFNMLDSRLQYVYDKIYEAIADSDRYTEYMPFLLSQSELDTAVRALLYDEPKLFYVISSEFDLGNHSYTKEHMNSGELVIRKSIQNGKTSVWIPYSANNDDDSEFLKKANERFKASLQKADNITENVKDPYLVCQCIHDYITTVCEKTDKGGVYADTAYGALVEGKATPVGYAKAFKLLYSRCGGKSYIVNNGELHWNVALINDKYYNIDCFTDDLDGEINGDAVPGAQSHIYLIIDDETLKIGHAPSPAGVAPVCTDKETHYTHNNLAPATAAEVTSAVQKQLASLIRAKKLNFELYCTLSDAEELIKADVKEYLKENGEGFADGCEIYRVSGKYPVYNIFLTQTKDTEAE